MNKLVASTTVALALVALPACEKRDGAEKPKREFGAALSPKLPHQEIWKEFSGENAMLHTERLVSLGPRPAGSEALESSRKYIITELAKAGWETERQTFIDETPEGPIEFVNLIARLRGSGTRTQQTIVASHYDTKLYREFEFVGANDGGSSTGALLELARVLALDPGLAWRIELVFFDGEEAILDFTETDGLYGSRHYIRELRAIGRHKQFSFGILWDMIGDKDLTITLPSDSPPDLARAVFKAAEALGTRKHFRYFPHPILDDHVPLTRGGIPTIDIIDFDFPAWHTREDTLDKVSPESMRIVGEVTLWILARAFPRG